MAKAPIIEHFTVKGYEDVTAGIVKWPLSVIRLQSKEVKPLIDLAEHILNADLIQMKMLSSSLRQTVHRTTRSHRLQESVEISTNST